MRRAFTLQLYDWVDPDICTRGECQGAAPNPGLIMPVFCLACARRRNGISKRRTSVWWRVELKPISPIRTSAAVVLVGPITTQQIADVEDHMMASAGITPAKQTR